MSNTTLPASRFAPASPGGRDALTYYLLLALAACALSIVLLAFTAFKPLGRAQIDPLAPVTSIPSVEPGSLAADERQDLIDELTAQNYFAHGRGDWVRPTRLAVKPEADPEPEQTRPVIADAGDSRVVNSRGEVITVLEKEDLSADFQRAFENLKLRGLFANVAGTPYAMITRRHEEKASDSTSFTVGDEFVEQKAAGEPWRVELIDLDAERVALSRGGTSVWLNLRERSIALALARSGASNRLFDPATSVPVVAQLTREQLMRELLEAGLTNTEINELFALADAMDAPPPPEPDAKVLGLANAVKDMNAPANQEDSEATGASASDIEALLEMMATNTPPTPEMLEKFNRPKRQ